MAATSGPIPAASGSKWLASSLEVAQYEPPIERMNGPGFLPGEPANLVDLARLNADLGVHHIPAHVFAEGLGRQ